MPQDILSTAQSDIKTTDPTSLRFTRHISLLHQSSKSSSCTLKILNFLTTCNRSYFAFNMHWNKNIDSYILILYTYMFINSKGNELWPTVHNSTTLHSRSRSNKDVILHKKWDKVENFYRKVQQEHILYRLNIWLKGSCRTDRWKGKG